MYELFAGPLVWVAVAACLGGLVAQGVRFFGLTRRRILLLPPGAPRPPWRGRKGLAALSQRGGALLGRLGAGLGRSIATSHPGLTAVTVTFHVLLFVTPIFLLGHNETIRQSIGVAPPALSGALADLLTAIVLLCICVFLFRRIFLARVRILTTGYDYFVLLLTAAPFATGLAAHHQILDYRTMLLAHVIAGEVLLVLIPWTRLGHALFFFLYRFLLPGEHGLARGSRSWKTSAAAG